jgi:hypothetical protein
MQALEMSMKAVSYTAQRQQLLEIPYSFAPLFQYGASDLVS